MGYPVVGEASVAVDPKYVPLGAPVWLSLDRAPLAAAATWIEQQRNLWSSRLDELEALLEAEQAEPPGGFR
jgi:membrane-bound lytic murein transglycosylase